MAGIRRPAARKADRYRWLDRYVGVPCCWVLSTLVRLRRRPSLPSSPPRRLLLIKLSEMGSHVLLAPMLRRVTAQWPACEVSFLTFVENVETVDVLNLTPQTTVVSVDTTSGLRFVLSTARAVRTLRRMQIDTVVDLEFFSRFTAMLAVLSGAPTRVGFHRFHSEGLYRGSLMTHQVPYNPHLHTAVSFLALIDALDHDPAERPLPKRRIDEPLQPPRFAPDCDLDLQVRQKLRCNGLDAHEHRRLFLLNPNASELAPIRKWPIDRYVELAQCLLDHPDHAVAIIGKGEDRREARVLTDAVRSDRCVDLTDQTNLRELLALMRMATALVTNDSGPAHFASTTGLPTVVLFGPESPALYAPLGATSRCLTAHFACSPCLTVANHRKTACRRARCLEAIEVSAVLSALGDLGVPGLGTQGRPPR